MKSLPRILLILIISVFLSYYLQVSLLVVSGLLFAWLLWSWQKAGSLENYRPDYKMLFSLSLFFTLGSKILFFLKGIFLTHDSLRQALDRPVIFYKICSLSASYQSFGFIKRGLIPTIVRLLSPDYIVQIYAVQLIGLASIIAGLWLIKRKNDFPALPKGIFIGVLLLSPIGVYSFFNFNLGFYDMILIGLLLVSIALGKSKTSTIADVVALLVHEAYIFLRLPFLLFSLVSLIRNKKPYASVLVSIVINLVVFLMIVKAPRPGFEELKSNYFSRYPTLVSRTSSGDMEAFLPLCKEGTLSSDFGVIRRFYATPRAGSFNIPISLSIIGVTLFGFFTNTISGKRRYADASASLVAFGFPLMLALVGGDFGRWLAFSYVLWAVYYFLFRPVLFPETKPSLSYIYAVLLMALVFLPFGINYHPLFYKLMGY